MTETCILYSGSVASSGYGRIWVGDKHILAHRAAYQEYYGAIPFDCQVHHLCRTKLCINPDHLIVLSGSDHKKIHIKEDGLRGAGLLNAEKTHCPQGHLLGGRNKRQRFCLPCKKIHQDKYAEKNREQTNAASRRWKQEHREEYLAKNREYMQKKRAIL